MQSPPPEFSKVLLLSPPVHLLGPSRRRHRRSHTLTRAAGAPQLRRWSLDPQDLCRLQSARRVTNGLGSATESIYSKFDSRTPREAEYPRLKGFGQESNVPFLCCGRVSPGLCSTNLCHCFLDGTVLAVTLKAFLPMRLLLDSQS